ncbi:MAG: hypothetical protein EOO02_19780, partial [Chitinophagaceae bacterium]
MIRNYFKVAIRNITRNKLMSSLNIMGLAIGLSAALVISLIVQYEFGFDKHYADVDRLYRVVMHMRFAETDFHNGGVPVPLQKVAKNEVSGLEKATPVFQEFSFEKVSLEKPGTSDKIELKKRPRVALVEEDYFQMFDKKFLAGSASGMDSIPNLVVLNETTAKLYYPQLPLDRVPGSVFYYNDTLLMKVAGVMADEKHSTDIDTRELVSMPTSKSAGLYNYSDADGQWGSVSSNNQFYLKLAKNSNPDAVTKQLQGLLTKYKKPEPGVDPKKNFSKFNLQPVTDMHFNENYGASADLGTMKGLMILAGFLLLL